MNTVSGFRRGQIGVVMTLVMGTLIGVIGLGADFGVLTFQWGQLRKAADSAALAGASELTGNPATTDNGLVTAAATKYATLNGIQKSEIVSITPAADAKSVSVVLTRNVPYYFFKLLGLSSGNVSVQASSAIQPTSGACGYLPIGLPCQFSDYANGHSTCGGKYATGKGLSIKADWKNNSQVPGNWEALSLGKSGGSQYSQNIAKGFAGAPTASCVGQSSASACPSWVSTETGNLVGPTTQGFSDRMNGQSYQPVPSGAIDPTSPQIVLAPLVDFKASGKGGKGSAPILDFVTLWVTNVDSSGNVTATIVPPVPGCGTPTTQASQDNGPYVATLTS
jgi:putative Flp pilus-assembly TadE/G-like protein